MKIFASFLLLIAGPALAASGSPVPADIDVVVSGAGAQFVSKDGLALYTYDADAGQPGTSVCVDECAKQWPPQLVSAEAKPVGDWSVVERPDGALQWAHKSRPVYRYFKDTNPGSLIGGKASPFWKVLFETARTPPGIAIKASLEGQVLVDQEQNPIFVNLAESCEDDCLNNWRGLEAPWLAGIKDPDWNISEQADDFRQWAYKGQLLYVYVGDEPLDAAAAADQGWQTLVLLAAPALPDWVTVQDTDFGPVLATRDNMTLYYLFNDPEKIARETCDMQCQQANWTRVVAAEGAGATGNWAIQEEADGTRYWMFMGRPIYTYNHDRIPGDTRGDKFGAGAGVRGGWMAIVSDTLVQSLN